MVSAGIHVFGRLGNRLDKLESENDALRKELTALKSVSVVIQTNCSCIEYLLDHFF